MAAQWPHVKAWLVATIPTLGISNLSVYAGPVASGDDPQKYVTVGFVTDDKGGTYQQTQSADGFTWDEVGEIRSEIAAQYGDTDGSLAESDAFAVADALEAAIRADHTLGGTLARNGTAESIVEVLSVSNPDGTATALVHTLRYTTTT